MVLCVNILQADEYCCCFVWYGSYTQLAVNNLKGHVRLRSRRLATESLLYPYRGVLRLKHTKKKELIAAHCLLIFQRLLLSESWQSLQRPLGALPCTAAAPGTFSCNLHLGCRPAICTTESITSLLNLSLEYARPVKWLWPTNLPSRISGWPPTAHSCTQLKGLSRVAVSPCSLHDAAESTRRMLRTFCHRDRTAGHQRKDTPVPPLSAPQIADRSPAIPERSLPPGYWKHTLPDIRKSL